MILPMRDLRQALKGYDAVRVSLQSDVKDSIQFTINDNEINITAEDVELNIMADIEQFKEPILLDGMTLEVLKKIKADDEVVISKKEINIGNMTIVHQGEINNPTLIDDTKYLHIGTFNPQEVKNAIKIVKHAVGNDAMRPILNNILWEGRDMVSVDGYRVSVAELEQGISQSLLLNKTAYTVLEKLLGKDEPVMIYTNGEQLKIEHGDWVLFTTIPCGDFLKYKQLFTDEQQLQFVINRKEWIEKLELLMVTVGKKNPVKFILDKGMKITGNTKEMESSVEVNGFEWKMKQSLRIAFNPKYIIEAIKPISDETVVVTMVSSLTPMVIYHSKGKELVLPVRLNV